MKKALLSYSRSFFDPKEEDQKFYSTSIIARSLHNTLIKAGYEVEYIDASESPAAPDSYDLFIGQPVRWTEIAKQCERALKILFMPTTHPRNRNHRIRTAQKKWHIPHSEELLDESPSTLQAFMQADYVMQIGNEINIDALLKNGIPREKILHIHYGLPPEWSAGAPRARASLDQYVHPASELGLRKGLPELIHTFSTSPFNKKNLTLVGEVRKNENPIYWQRKIRELEKSNPHVNRVGFINSTSKKYKETLAAHGWYLFPSVEEGEPGTTLEAMTLGLVPVLTREGGVDFAIDDDFKASFNESLLKTLRTTREQWEILSAKARRQIGLFHDHATWEKRLGEIFLSLRAGEKDLRPSASIILTVHNKEKHIVRLLRTLVKNTRSYPKWDLHVVYDGCKDASRAAAQEILRDFPVPVYEHETPDIWEVRANNVGLKNAQGKYCIILQDDNFIYEPAWMEKMLSWLEEHPRVGILGGLGGVNFFHLDSDPQGPGVNRSTFELHQRLDPAAQKELREYVFEADAVMRGPIILRKELLEKHGYLDEAYAPIYNDDMDYCLRMRSLGYGVFCYPIDVVNESLTVATYKDPAKDKFWKDTSEKNQKLFYSRWKDDIERYHAVQLKLPKPIYETTSGHVRPGLAESLKRHIFSLKLGDLRKRIRVRSRAIFLQIPAPLMRMLIKMVKKFGTRGESLAETLHIHYFESRTIPWRLVQGDTTLRLDYPLTSSSKVRYIGVIDEAWISGILSRYGCNAQAADAEDLMREAKSHIDLLCLHMKGGEYSLLEKLIRDGSVRNIQNIQVRFDESVPDAKERMRAIQKQLRETHSLTYQYEFVWENWEIEEGL